MPREIATLQHELIMQHVNQSHFLNGGIQKKKKTHVGDDPMERAARITETVLARRELAEIPCGVWYHVIEQAEHDSACRLRVDGDVELLSGTNGTAKIGGRTRRGLLVS